RQQHADVKEEILEKKPVNVVQSRSSKDIDLPRGVGTVVWYLCQILLRTSLSSQTQDSDITALIERILLQCCDLNIELLNESILPYWTPTQSKQYRDAVQAQRAQRAQRASKAKKRAIAKIKKRKHLFTQKNQALIHECADVDEYKEQQPLFASCGVGLDYLCVVCQQLAAMSEPMGFIALAT
ncbi:hypothetical protein RFI_36961, partial [Reticulomyxa filosa]